MIVIGYDLRDRALNYDGREGVPGRCRWRVLKYISQSEQADFAHARGAGMRFEPTLEHCAAVPNEVLLQDRIVLIGSAPKLEYQAPLLLSGCLTQGGLKRFLKLQPR